MYVLVPITFHKCCRGLQTLGCPASAFVETQNFLHFSACDRQEVLASRATYDAAKDEYDKILTHLAELCTKCEHNKSK